MRIRIIFLTILLLLCFFCLGLCTAVDKITPSRYIKDPEVITSNGGSFKLGFFSPDDSTYRYVGIWYNSASAINCVWVANRNNPLKDSSGILKISEDGNLVVLNGQNEIFWSSNVLSSGTDSSAQILDTGNLVLKNDSSGIFIWESFKYASNSFLAKMETSSNATAGNRLTSWKSPSDPSIGDFSLGLISLNIPQLFIWNKGKPYWRSGPWNGQVFIGIPGMSTFYLQGFKLVEDGKGTYTLSYSYLDKSSFMNYALKSKGQLDQLYWKNGMEGWSVLFSAPRTQCDVYGKCGAFGNCFARSSPICSCLKGFEPKIVEEWNRGNWTRGCIRSKPLQCERVTLAGGELGKQDGFLKLEKVKFPDHAEWSTAFENECRDQCLKNCSCLGYAHDSGIGCMFWNENLIDVLKFYPDETDKASDLYIRLAYSELERKKDLKPIIISVAIVGTFSIVICTFFSWKRIVKPKEGLFYNRENILRGDDMNRVKLQEMQMFKFEELSTATNNFDPINQLGQGGFGPVYRGNLRSGQEIAVKRLSRASGQGLEEFMNEVIVISKLQHRNLVRLYGCCVDAEESMLVYEYMPNKSLDAIIFDPAKHDNLKWKKRINIIEGIGRGLLYLHRDSRLRIIHRDLKASNILLDEELNPKISDFGMARIFGVNEDQANTTRVVGTYGYMSPEYAMEGRFSEKSDVYSFGVLLLEIVSGKKISTFFNEERSLSLVGYAWELWNENNALDLIPPATFDPCFKSEILRAIHVGLLCVQQYAEDRPTVSTVILMLTSEIVDLPPPFQPGFTVRPTMIHQESPQPGETIFSQNDITLTIVEAR